MGDSNHSHYDPFWDRLIPRRPESTSTDPYNTFTTINNDSTSTRNAPDLFFPRFPPNPYNNNARTPEDSRNRRTSTYQNSASALHNPGRSFYEPILGLNGQQNPTTNTPFGFSVEREPQQRQEQPPSQSDRQTFRLPGIDALTQNVSPVERPRSSSHLPWDSPSDNSLFNDSDFWPTDTEPDPSQSDNTASQPAENFIDLTSDFSPAHHDSNNNNNMPPVTRKRRISARATPPPSPKHPPRTTTTNKRRKTTTSGLAAAVKDEEENKIEELDLSQVNDDQGLSKVLEQQQAAVIKEQQDWRGDKPLRLADVQCVVCMEPMVNITATHCGIQIMLSDRDLLMI
ncbi:MAG: hypothetical protein Q9219_001414 [cf. Caloplaca sp. 3 TL-2023]